MSDQEPRDEQPIVDEQPQTAETPTTQEKKEQETTMAKKTRKAAKPAGKKKGAGGKKASGQKRPRGVPASGALTGVKAVGKTYIHMLFEEGMIVLTPTANREANRDMALSALAKLLK